MSDPAPSLEEVERDIPDGGIRHIVPEPVYLTVLARHLRELGRTGDAEAVEKLILVRRL